MQLNLRRLSRTQWVLVAVVALLVVLLSVLTLTGGGRPLIDSLVPDPPDCTVEADGRTVELSTAEAEDAASAVARAVRDKQRGTAPTAIAAVLKPDDRPGEDDLADAATIAAALTGRAPAALTCTHGGAHDAEQDQLDRRGLTARAAVVRRDLRRLFPGPWLGGFARGGVSTGHMPGSAHYDGRAIDAFFRPVNQRNRVRGWAMAQYLVAHADRLSVNTVIFDDQIWTHRRASEGWRDYEVGRAGRNARVRAVLEHRDHVHVDVAD